MRFGPSACRRAVQRRVRALSDSVWITDDVLSEALQRFHLVARCSRRDASSVPGPMESRRRIGKRRIAHLSEAVYIPGRGINPIWDMGRASGSQKWQWQAPSKRQQLPVAGGTPHLPAWLSEYQPVPVDELSEHSTVEESIMEDANKLVTNIEDDLLTFKKSMKAEPTNQIQALCDLFNHRFKQNADLGLISEDMLYESLRCITKIVRETTEDELLVASRCYSFYQAAWNGIMGSKVRRAVDLRGDLLKNFLLLLGQLPSTLAVQNLAIAIIKTASQDQIIQMEDGILAVVGAWLSSWTSLKIDCSNIRAKAIIHPQSHDVPNKCSISESTVMLSRFLSHLPSTMTKKILPTSTDHLISTLTSCDKPSHKAIRNIRYSWISVVANMPRVDEALLKTIWSKMSFSKLSSKSNLSLHECCNLLLDFWISHGQVEKVERVREIYMAYIQKHGQSDGAGYLVQALHQCEEDWKEKAKCLFRFLRRLTKPAFVYQAFRNLVAQGLIPALFVRGQIKAMARINPRCAVNMYKEYDRARHDKTRFLPEWCPDFIAAMIRSPEFTASEIWTVVNVPLHLSGSTTVSPLKPLSPLRIRLVHRMAVEFAAADCRTPRSSLRDVLRCMLYLRRHGAWLPVSSDLSRALTEAGITRGLLSEHWIGRRKADWILGIVREVEGLEISRETEQVLQLWLAEQITQQQKVLREANPLRVGPID